MTPTTTGRPVAPGASRKNADTCDTTDDELPRRPRGSGYPGKADYGSADSYLRRALAKLARDPDPEARRAGAQLAEEATNALRAITMRAHQASTAQKRAEARAEKLGAQIGAQIDRATARHRPTDQKGPTP